SRSALAERDPAHLPCLVLAANIGSPLRLTRFRVRPGWMLAARSARPLGISKRAYAAGGARSAVSAPLLQIAQRALGPVAVGHHGALRHRVGGLEPLPEGGA